MITKPAHITAKTRKPAMTAEEKKALATAKKQANLSIQGRCQFKATGRVLIQIEDRNDKTPETFHTTLINGKVTSCINIATGETCEGRRWSGHCCHGDRALQYEVTREAELAEAAIIESSDLAEMAKHNDVQAHVEDSIRSGALSWAEQQRAARATMSDDERAEQLLALGERRWMAA